MARTRPTQAIGELRDLIARIPDLRRMPSGNSEVDVWFDDLISTVEKLCGKESQEYRMVAQSPQIKGGTVGYPGEPPSDFIARVTMDQMEGAAKVVLNRLEKGRAPTPVTRAISEPSPGRPKVFISHGPPGRPLDILSEFLKELGIEPVIVEEQPSEGRSVVGNVEKYASDCAAAIVLATADRLVGNDREPNPGVLVEIGDLRKRFGSKVIYLVQSGVKRSSMWSEQVYIEFKEDCMDDALIKIIRELRAAGLLQNNVIKE